MANRLAFPVGTSFEYFHRKISGSIRCETELVGTALRAVETVPVELMANATQIADAVEGKAERR